MWDEPYEPDDDDTARRRAAPDPLSDGVGAVGYIDRYVLDACREQFPESRVVRHPERFDRFYFASSVGPLLIDILIGDSDQMATQRERKHVAFKAAWCREHERQYLVLSEGEADDAAQVRALLARLADEETGPEPEINPATKQPSRRRGGIERPKAAA